MKKLITISAVFTIGIVSAFAVAFMIDGKWVGKTNMDGNDIPLTYNFKADGNKLTGSAESPYGVSAIDNGKIKGDSISFSTNVSGMDISQMGRVYADSVNLDILVNGNVLHATLKRSK